MHVRLVLPLAITALISAAPASYAQRGGGA